MSAPDWVSIGEAASKAGVDPEIVRGWASQGRVRIKLVQDRHSYRLGYQVALSDVERVAKEPAPAESGAAQPQHQPASPEFQALLVRISHVQESLNEQVRAFASIDARVRFELDSARTRGEEGRAEIASLRATVEELERALHQLRERVRKLEKGS